MKSILQLLLIALPMYISAQPLTASNSTIYKGDAEFLYYKSEVTDVLPRYNYEILNTSRKPILEAFARMYEVPVKELKTFYYYTIIFPDTQDSLAVYFNGGLFIDTLSHIIEQYSLVKYDKIDTAAKRKFLITYNVQPILSRLADMQEYLEDYRWLSDQVVRDRKKPVIIKNNNEIFQDGKKIGYMKDLYGYPGSGDVFFVNDKLVASREASFNGMAFKTFSDERLHNPYDIEHVPLVGKQKKKIKTNAQLYIEFLVRNYYL